MRNLFLSLALAVAAASAAGPEKDEAGESIKEAAACYHQGRYDSALARLEPLKSQGLRKHRDSLSLFQYLGMSSARLGLRDKAAGYFSDLLAVDSLFQFPRNEDPLVQQAFAAAREQRAVPEKPTSAPQVTLAPLPIPQAQPPEPLAAAPRPEKISLADSGASRGMTPLVPTSFGNRRIGLAMGAVPLGAGWLAGSKVKRGLALGVLQGGGIILSVFASQMQSSEQNDAYGVQDANERAKVQTWQWVQRVSLSTALGAYLFSIIASAGD